MKLQNDHWIDSNRNKWCANTHTYEQAVRNSRSLVACYGNTDCSNSKHLSHCHDLHGEQNKTAVRGESSKWVETNERYMHKGRLHIILG
jgi:hypothetical protein